MTIKVQCKGTVFLEGGYRGVEFSNGDTTFCIRCKKNQYSCGGWYTADIRDSGVGALEFVSADVLVADELARHLENEARLDALADESKKRKEELDCIDMQIEAHLGAIRELITSHGGKHRAYLIGRCIEYITGIVPRWR